MNSNFLCNKMILCKNIIATGFCSYDKKCKFAHDYDEQLLTNERKKIINILNKKHKNNNQNKNIISDKLYNELLILTKLCNNCINNKCVGGYNCKFGACNNNILFCKDNLSDECINKKCNKHHITDYNYLSYNNNNNKFFIDNIINSIINNNSNETKQIHKFDDNDNCMKSIFD